MRQMRRMCGSQSMGHDDKAAMYRVFGRFKGVEEVAVAWVAGCMIMAEWPLRNWIADQWLSAAICFVLSRTSLLQTPECSSLLADKAMNHWGGMGQISSRTPTRKINGPPNTSTFHSPSSTNPSLLNLICFLYDLM
jgi:hypothetical protein